MRTSVDVHNFLQSEVIQHEFFSLDGQAKSAKRAAAVLGLTPHLMAKTLLFMVDDRPVLVIVPGDCRADEVKIRTLLKADKVIFAEVSLVFEMTGFCIGATPPVALETEMETVIDQEVLNNEIIYTSGGEANKILKVRSKDLLKVTNAHVGDVCI